ncbi:protein of unknown function [Candidatus Nitrospira inopinata]|uniref:Uncharacterized protein n=1 Tax=Candidatus Nitrospira inopinata TaxID=1715989 RepID=A0A0S4KS86_9BACT|nr:protein of unknown function [Candidatus Nitrospira inopinata]
MERSVPTITRRMEVVDRGEGGVIAYQGAPQAVDQAVDPPQGVGRADTAMAGITPLRQEAYHCAPW